MNPCPDTATLASLESALHWAGLDGVEHVAGCAACRADLAMLEALRDSVQEILPDAALTPNVLRAVREDRPASSRVRSLAPLPAAAACAWFALAFGWWSATGQPGMPPASAAVFALVAGASFTWRTHARNTSPPRLSPP